MLRSMTGFASAQGVHDKFSWTSDIRSVNAKGLGLRLHVPDWLPGLETALKAKLSKAVQRGNVSLTLRLCRSEAEAAFVFNSEALGHMLDAIAEIEVTAWGRGLDRRCGPWPIY